MVKKSVRSCGSVGVALKEINGPRLCIGRPIAEDADTRQGPNIVGAAEDYFLDSNATLGDSLHIKCLLTHRAYVNSFLALRAYLSFFAKDPTAWKRLLIPQLFHP